MHNINHGDVVFCTDRNPTIKKDMLPSYKYSRTHQENVRIEKGVAEYILDACGCSIFARAGYEADDIIYTIVRQCHEMYDDIVVYTGDSDLYFLVDHKVHIEPISTTTKRVTFENFENVLVHGKSYRYNTITFGKLLHGDTSDNIPALDKESQAVVKSLFGKESMWPMLGDRDMLIHNLEIVCPKAALQAKLVFPLTVEDIPTEFKRPDWETLCCFGNAMHNKNFRNYTKPDFDIEYHIQEMQSRGLYLEEVN